MKIKARSTGAPPISGAEAFARLLVAMVEKRPILRVVGGDKVKHHKTIERKKNERV